MIRLNNKSGIVRAGLLVMFFFCLVVTNFQKPSDGLKKQRAVSAVRFNTAQQLKKERGLICSGIGAEMMYEVKNISLYFLYWQEVTLDEGRDLILAATDQLLNEVNNSEEIRPYLANYPFLAENITVMILVYPDKVMPVENPQHFIMSGGKFKYKLDDEKGNLQTFLEESYEEATEKNKKKAA